jgi:hypothetical protein
MTTKLKDPDAVLDYGWDWSAWLNGDTITASSWTVEAGITADSDTFDATTTTIWLSGGTVGTSYALVNHITTAAGREDDRTLTVTLREK